jgi:peptidoglycan/xylan/chitin deacetylase (PgdA/CDA1 family)
MRPDRLLTLALARPAMALAIQPRRRRVPILMYHGIRDAVGNKAAYFETNTSPKTFAVHMQYLRDYGYTTATLSQAAGYISGVIALEKPVVITFDDGFKDFCTRALPVLCQHSFTATMFVVSEFAGAEGTSFADNQCMTWQEVREIQSEGIEIGSHTASHPVLHGLSRQRLVAEISKSKAAIEDNIGRTVTSFSYPFAFPEHDRPYVQTLRTLLRECGYQNGVSTIIGTAGPSDETYFLPRLPVNSHDDLRLLRAKLEGAYDWLHVAQRSYKSLFGRTL